MGYEVGFVRTEVLFSLLRLHFLFLIPLFRRLLRCDIVGELSQLLFGCLLGPYCVSDIWGHTFFRHNFDVRR
jgi:hypothetical protein